ncbi:dehydrogenase/reductase SDR family member 7 [Eurosta solidaginis]|uniref:dehydrogenase/reductase SDR family member 7 n=1 Tax=Eurosta solidaginis TaxID=178769 RepID=UPI0035309F2D
MSSLELLFLLLICCFIIYVIHWIILDCNVELWYKTHFGVPISSMRGQVVWVTGASSGIGRGLALVLAKNGIRLAISARREHLLDSLKRECLELSNGLLSESDVLVLPMDMLKLADHEKHFQIVINHFGRLDVLVNNAGRSQRANWEEIKIDVDHELFELDVFSVMNLSRIVVRHFVKNCDGHGHIAVTSSIAGLCEVPFSATYCAAKAAINSYYRALCLEQRNIDVTIFCPGPIATDFLQEAFTAEPGQKHGGSTKGQKRMTSERCGVLYASAIANKLNLSFCAMFPVVFLAYACQYSIFTSIFRRFLVKGTLNRIREGKI